VLTAIGKNTSVPYQNYSKSFKHDRELLAGCRHERNEGAFSQLVERYSRLVYSVCVRTLNDRQAAEDASQAVFLVFAQRFAELPPDTVLPRCSRCKPVRRPPP